MSPPNDSDQPSRSGRAPVRPWGPPPGAEREAVRSRSPLAGHGKIPLLSVLMFVLLVSGVLIQAWQELSTPDGWALWRDQFISSSLTASVVQPAPSAFDSRAVLAVSGKIGPAAAPWFRKELDNAGLRPGDTVAFSSPGGSVDQAIIMGEEIRLRGLKTAVAAFDAEGRMRAASCASACVLSYAGGVVRFGVPSSRLGVHRFTSKGASDDPVADTQRMGGLILRYMRRMGVDSSIVEMMSATEEVRWLTQQQTAETKLVSAPLARP